MNDTHADGKRYHKNVLSNGCLARLHFWVNDCGVDVDELNKNFVNRNYLIIIIVTEIPKIDKKKSSENE